MIKNPNKISEPIAIGGLGGSGTRLIAQILIDSGVYMGNKINESNDNLIFTRLFKHPQWFCESKKNEILKHLIIFTKYMKGEIFNLNELKIFYKFSNKYEPLFFLNIIKEIITNYKNNLFNKKSIWGWKEPNTHIFLEYISKFYKGLKYIHVIRHGLDMAFSNNKQQLYNWGKIFEVNIPDDPKLLPKAQLEYWIKSNKQAISTGEKLLGDRFYLLYYDSLCKNPGKEIKKLLKFLNLEVNKDTFNKLIKLPAIPASSERYKDKDLTVFIKKEFEEVLKLGFDTKRDV